LESADAGSGVGAVEFDEMMMLLLVAIEEGRKRGI
jgi:hypothetical protein